jgi:broad specificity phosphatase PhoE
MSVAQIKLAMAAEGSAASAPHERPEQVAARQAAMLAEWATLIATLDSPPADHSRHRVLCISHGGFLKLFYSHFLGQKIPSFPNCSISILRITWDGCFSFKAIVTAVDITDRDSSIAAFDWPLKS